MAFRFRRKESVQKAIRRIAQERIERALDCMQDADRLEAIHRVRMEIKKIRALLRLLRRASRGSLYQNETTLLREAANSLGAVRDAHVTLKALSELTSHFKAQLPAQSFKDIKRTLKEHCERATAEYEKNSHSNLVTKNLRKAQQDLRGLRLANKGWQALCPGLQAVIHANPAEPCANSSLPDSNGNSSHIRQ